MRGNYHLYQQQLWLPNFNICSSRPELH